MRNLCQKGEQRAQQSPHKTKFKIGAKFHVNEPLMYNQKGSVEKMPLLN